MRISTGCWRRTNWYRRRGSTAPISPTARSAARIFRPIGNTKLEKRLPLSTAPTLPLWGAADRIMPRSYADKFARGIAGKSEIRVIPGAGHLAELDQPDAVAAAILAWTAPA